MRIIDLFVGEVGRKLPAKSRSDIEAELRSTLMDMLDDRARKENREPDEAMAKSLLKEYGSPDQVAATYLPEQYLIGPKLYPTFVMILKIILIVVSVLTVVGLGIRIGQTGFTGQEVATLVGETFLHLMQALVQALGSLVLVFALMQRFAPADKEFKTEWNPDDLNKIQEPDRIKMSEIILGIVFSTLGIVIFNFYPDLISIYQNVDGSWTRFPFLTDTFYSYLLFLNGIWILEIVMNALVLKDGKWTRTTRGFDIGIQLMNVVLLIVMIAGKPIVQLPIDMMLNNGMTFETSQMVQTQFVVGIRTVLGLVAAISTIEAVRKGYRLVKS